jgi:hypothetical protein
MHGRESGLMSTVDRKEIAMLTMMGDALENVQGARPCFLNFLQTTPYKRPRQMHCHRYVSLRISCARPCPSESFCYRSSHLRSHDCLVSLLDPLTWNRTRPSKHPSLNCWVCVSLQHIRLSSEPNKHLRNKISHRIRCHGRCQRRYTEPPTISNILDIYPRLCLIGALAASVTLGGGFGFLAAGSHHLTSEMPQFIGSTRSTQFSNFPPKSFE